MNVVVSSIFFLRLQVTLFTISVCIVLYFTVTQITAFELL
jgi:hypothetical protein